jgi:ribosomal protein S18 acetylase RimI-like enzyme
MLDVSKSFSPASALIYFVRMREFVLPFRAALSDFFQEAIKLKAVKEETATITLRPVGPDDENFLYEVYRSARAEEMAAWGWEASQQELFLKMQLKARDQSHLMHYQAIDDHLILCGDEKIGRLIVSRNAEEIRLVDISLLSQYRNAGIGASLIEALFAEAGERPVRLQVDKANAQARRLYERMGFSLIGETQTHFQMERNERNDECGMMND